MITRNVYLQDGTSHLAPTRMEVWGQRLPPSFVRTHRSHIVNIRRALALSRRQGGWIIDVHSELIPVSRSRFDVVRAALRAHVPLAPGAPVA